MIQAILIWLYGCAAFACLCDFCWNVKVPEGAGTASKIIAGVCVTFFGPFAMPIIFMYAALKTARHINSTEE